jgi:outer membrane protein TolC
VVQNLYTGGAITSQLAIARLNEEKRALEYQALVNRVSMDVRLAFYDVLLNRAKIRVREQSVQVFEEELKTQRERFETGTVGSLNVSRAEVALANEQPELIDAQTRLQNSELRLGQLIGVDSSGKSMSAEAAGQLQYAPKHPDLTECLAYADVTRPEVRARQIDVQIEEAQLILDRSETRPRVEAFAGYEAYSERDPAVGPEFNHGFVVGLNATWHIFDGFATRGRLQATRARRDAALHALEAAKLSVASDVRSAFLDLQQADRVLQSETRNVQNADEVLEIAKGNLGAGLGTQLDILQAASDVTRTRTTRLGAIYLHNVALARLARATAREPDSLGFAPRVTENAPGSKAIADVAAPPATLGGGR